MTELLLRIEGLQKHFGGLVATDDLTFDIREGELHALIGPNGAGKTTLISQIMGELPPDAGSIALGGHDLVHLGPAARVRHGLARTFQIVQLLPESTARETVMLALEARRGHGFRFWRNGHIGEPRDEAQDFLQQTGLGARGDIVAANLSHGEQKQLELAIALATGPKLLLLDEPLAGLGAAESQEMVAILRGLKGRVTMLLVEHDMDAVYELADRISVLVNGRLIATGTAPEIQANASVRDAYLGEAG